MARMPHPSRKTTITIDPSQPLESPILGPRLIASHRRAFEAGYRLGACLGVLVPRIMERFGALPAWAVRHLFRKSVEELLDISKRFPDATTIHDLFKSSPPRPPKKRPARP